MQSESDKKKNAEREEGWKFNQELFQVIVKSSLFKGWKFNQELFQVIVKSSLLTVMKREVSKKKIRREKLAKES